MENVFDLVEDFYEQDPEWNTVLRQEYAENFLRTMSWQGADDADLRQQFSYIMMLCLYLGNTEGFLGDMTRDDFVDCVAWFGRNITEFKTSAKTVDRFLVTMEKLYTFLAGKKIIMSDDAPGKARQVLLNEGKLCVIDSSGEFLPGNERYSDYAAADLPNKIFMNLNKVMADFMQLVRNYFSDRRFHMERERANFLFQGTLINNIMDVKPDKEEYEHCFWDYFLFDYHMIADDKRPIEHFYDAVKQVKISIEDECCLDLLEELIKTRLVLFTVEGVGEEGFYSCRDFFTGQPYNFLLPIDEGTNTDGFIFLGHIFYNENMVMNFVRGTNMPNIGRKKFYEVMDRAREWMAVRTGGELSWDAFIRRNPIFVRQVSLLYSAYLRLDGFSYETAVHDYTPAPIEKDNVCQAMELMMRPYSFSAYDIKLAQTMWMDFLRLQPRRARLPDVWAAGVVKNFIDANAVYNYDLQKISEICHNIPVGAINNAADRIKNVLKIEQHDPRYINEEGLLLMLLS